MNDALEHVTVVELGAYAAGPAIGKYLANFGARVIHVESGHRPDGFRLQYPPFKDNRAGLNRSGCFAFFNDSKHGITLNLKQREGQELALRLIDRADIVIENMRPGVMAKLGLAPAVLRQRQPGLIVLSTTNMGQTGPYARHPGFGSQLSSLSGFTELIGWPDGPPQLLYGPYIDLIAVAFGGCVALAALDRRRRTGEGAYIDLSQYEAGLQFIGSALIDCETNGVVARRAGNRDAVAIPHGCYPCLRDGWCAISCWDEAEWQRLCEVAGRPDWRQDPRFATAVVRRRHERELNARIATWTRAHDAPGLMKRLQAAGVHAASVNTMRDLFDDPQLAERGIWQRHDHAELGALRYRMLSYQLSETPGSVRSAAPRLGEHNEEVFRDWLGMSADEYQTLAASGVFS
jgi:crotonobetainyl-CoA:carnitine CoA-transferase CaiB-like acyl-CoA transferase